MIRNYLRIALRNLSKNKSYVSINILGLGVSMACCITAYLLLAFNIEFDTFHDDEKVASIYRIHTLSTEKNGKQARDDQAPLVMTPIAADEIAGIESYARFLYGGGSVRYEDNAFNEQIAFTDSSFFNLFDYPLKAGSHESFKEKNAIFLNEELAKKYFGNDDPIGKQMTMSFVNDMDIDVFVGGVLAEYPVNNTFNFSLLMRIENYTDIYNIGVSDWSDWRNPSSFVKLSPSTHPAQISESLTKYIATRNQERTDMVVDRYELVPFKSSYDQDTVRSNWVTLRMNFLPLLVFGSLALLILLIACFNLTNTSIAMAGKRLKEVGVRKAVGASRNQVISQFLLETIIIITMSVVMGLLLAQVIVPAFVHMWRLPYDLSNLSGLNLIIALLILIFTASLLAGLYPALLSSNLKPSMLLKGGVKVKSTNLLTRILVGAQFALSVIVLIAGIVFIRNTRFQEGIRFGYDKDMIITMRIQGEREFEVMEDAIQTNPKIISVAVSDGNLGNNSYQTPITVDTAKYDVRAMGVGKNYLATMGLKISQGRDLDVENASDQDEGVIVNKTFVEKTGLTDPIEKLVILHDKRRRILGVVENHIDNLFRSKEMEPFIFYPAAKNQYITMLVKTEPQHLPEIQEYLKKTWKEHFPNRPFESEFQEDIVLEGSRETNANLEKVFLFITILGTLLSASGIFALASLSIARRTKEIGIRKALGATVGNVVFLLNKEFVVILIIAGIVGGVGGYMLTDALLAAIYAYRIPVGIVTAIFCATFIFLLGVFTTSGTIYRAARSNPVDTLRTE